VLIDGFARRADLSARSTLVTVLGDTVAPAGGSIWLSDLFDLVAPFGFTERLLRTSMTRLVNAGWCTPVRDGRRSRYVLTPEAAAETAEAEARIYARTAPTWDGEWTLVLVDGRVDPALRWNGFAELGPGLWGLPHDGTDRHERVVARLGLAKAHPVATARFVDIERLLDGDRLVRGLQLDDLIVGYREFVDRYQPLDGLDPETVEPPVAFAVRTMLVHDLRRLRLRDPDLPSILLPDPWIGAVAYDLARAVYRAVTERAWAWAATTAAIDRDRLDERVDRRLR
jgi:phenylacetic acid degradation operon negative regulatory protein